MSVQDLSVQEFADQCGLALLYHSTFASPPAVLGKALHNVAPDTLFRHLEALSRAYRFVSVDEYCQAPNRKGLATVTVARADSVDVMIGYMRCPTVVLAAVRRWDTCSVSPI